MNGSQKPLGLVADIGGTNARFAIAHTRGAGYVFEPSRDYHCCEFETFPALVEKFLRDAGQAARLKAVIAVAGPVSDNLCVMTNGRFVVDGRQLERDGLFSDCKVINDFAALASSLPDLSGDDLMQIGPSIVGEKGARLVVGPGTGLGAAFLVPTILLAPASLGQGRATHIVLEGEGGHMAFAPFDELEAELWRWFGKKHQRVSAERILSGPGLADLHEALAQIKGRSCEHHNAEKIMEAGVASAGGERETLERFCAMLGSFAGDLALAGGCRGGVCIAGGIVPRMPEIMLASDFRRRFEAKGRFKDKMSRIPTSLIIHKSPALLGAANYL